MAIFQILLTLSFSFVCLTLIGLVLLQKGKGGGLTGAFGAGGGSDTFLGAIQNREIVRWTTYVAIAFFSIAVLCDFVPPQRKGVDLGDLGAGAPVTAPAGETGQPATGAASSEAPSGAQDEALPSGAESSAPNPSGGSGQ
jgi:preprotein translocase subunit SecG